jgi:hypothetical protein
MSEGSDRTTPRDPTLNDPAFNDPALNTCEDRR